MIMFIDDEFERSRRWREWLEKQHDVDYLGSAEAALAAFANGPRMAQVQLVILDLSMYTTGDLTENETEHGRLTGLALRRRLRLSGWKGPLIVLSNSRDDAVRHQVEASEDGDLFLRKPETRPSQLADIVAQELERSALA